MIKLSSNDWVKLVVSVIIVVLSTILTFTNMINVSQLIGVFLAVMGYVYGHTNGYTEGYKQCGIDTEKREGAEK
jgi:hypothetical protein